jgi:methylmalonyl-CoA mutase cobalamin-binding subunit
VFRPRQGWLAYPGHKRISHTWVRQARAAGISAVQLVVGGVRAEFTIEELAQP